MFQSKSKKLTELSKLGIEESLRSDFRDAVQDAYEQGLVCRKAIIDKKNKLVKANGEELVLDESIDDAYIVCLTLDHYPAVAHQLDVFLRRQAEDPDPLAMSILDLDILAFYLRDPFEFLYYVNQRVKFTEHFKAESELALLGFHLSQKLFPRENVNATLIDERFAQLIDANFPAAKGHQPLTAAAQRLRSKWSNETFERLIEQIKNTRQPGLTDALYRMYDLAGKGADDLVRWMVKVKRRALQDKQSHDFSTVFRGEWGFSFLCSPNAAIKPNERLAALAMARKYKSKSNEWLAFGSLADSPNMVDSIAYSKEPWKPDSELEELTRTILKVGEVRGVDGKKLGRNQPCVCGSGKKFKRCCL